MLTAEGKLEPDLALDWTYTREVKTWTVTIRKDVFFHSGQPVTADDVRYSLMEIINVTPHTVTQKMGNIAVFAEDCLEMRFEQDDDGFLKKIWKIPIIRKPRHDEAAEPRPSRRLRSIQI